jgi:hypothetical protein
MGQSDTSATFVTFVTSVLFIFQFVCFSYKGTIDLHRFALRKVKIHLGFLGTYFGRLSGTMLVCHRSAEAAGSGGGQTFYFPETAYVRKKYYNIVCGRCKRKTSQRLVKCSDHRAASAELIICESNGPIGNRHTSAYFSQLVTRNQN